MNGPVIARKEQRDRLVGMGAGKGSHEFAVEELFGLGFGGQVEKCALAVAFDRVAWAAGVFSSLQPRRPASGDGFNPSDVTKRVDLGFGFGCGLILRRIAYTMLALFRSVTQRSDERRATPWLTLTTDLFVALITTLSTSCETPNRLPFSESTTDPQG